MPQDLIGVGSGDLQLILDASRGWHGSFAEWSGGDLSAVNLDVPLGKRALLHGDVLAAHEITLASLAQHDDMRCVIRGLAAVTGDAETYLEGELQAAGVQHLDGGVRPSQIRQWCELRGLGMQWRNSGVLLETLPPDQATFALTQTGRAWTLVFDSRDGHAWVYRRGTSLLLRKDARRRPAPCLGERWFAPRSIPQDRIQTKRQAEVPCQDPVWTNWQLLCPKKRKQESG